MAGGAEVFTFVAGGQAISSDLGGEGQMVGGNVILLVLGGMIRGRRSMVVRVC